MTPTTPAVEALARRLIAFEALRDPSDGESVAAARACETLRGPLAKFVGVAGYRSLLSRALAMAKAEVASLGPVQVSADGSLEGLGGGDPNQDAEAGAVVVARLLGLLVTFIGEPLTLRLVGDAWPDANQVETDRLDEERS